MAAARDGTAHARTTLTGVGFLADQTPELEGDPAGDPLARQVADADSAALVHARRRLARRLPTQALQAADQYFAVPDVKTWDGGQRPEPDADVLLLSPTRRAAVTSTSAPVELRQFDRRCPGWAPFADDVTAVTGADVVLRLVVSDGESTLDAGPRSPDRRPASKRRPATGWHRDGSDVLVTVIDGAERIAVASTEPPDAEPEPELDTVLRAGDALRLPRSMLHRARPDAGGCAMLEMRLRRVTDWSLRHAAPKHLGFRDYPRSLQEYRLCLRSHVPATPTMATGWDPDGSLLRTRIPGGLAVLGIRGPDVTFVAAGAVYRTSRPVVRALAGIHAADGIQLPEVIAASGVSAKAARSAVDGLLGRGLVRLDPR